jgi:hypothetical protein
VGHAKHAARDSWQRVSDTIERATRATPIATASNFAAVAAGIPGPPGAPAFFSGSPAKAKKADAGRRRCPAAIAGCSKVASFAHPEPPHDGRRSLVGGGRERDHRGELENSKRDAQVAARAASLANPWPHAIGAIRQPISIAVANGISSRTAVEPDEAQEAPVLAPLHRPHPPAAKADGRARSIHQARRSPRGGERIGKMLHHPRVGVHRGERLAVRVTPLTQE